MVTADYYIIAVPTPFIVSDSEKKADLRFVDQAAASIASVLKVGQTVILESTVPVGATDRLAAMLAELSGLVAGTDFFVAHCPERVIPGKTFYELIHNSRTIGGVNEASVVHAQKFYAPFVRGSMHLTNAKTAEMVKLVENSSRDVAIAFANQVASMATAAGLNPYDVIDLANKHPRVNILKPGCGVGGHCIAVDPWFLVETFPEETTLLQAARRVNDAKPYEVLQLIKTALTQVATEKPRVLLLGLTYKADVDDLRESPAIIIAQAIKGWEQCELMVCEPHVAPSKLKALFAGAVVSLEQGLGRADVVVSLVGHQAFKDVSKQLKADQQMLDFCGLTHEVKKDGHICFSSQKTSRAEAAL
jgi:UDP-N-acetyl-D-mannosaminuronic acid dehydrogenase